jgi:hypothetical protein
MRHNPGREQYVTERHPTKTITIAEPNGSSTKHCQFQITLTGLEQQFFG